MPDNTPESVSGVSSEGSGFAPITSQEELNRIIGERLVREREKFADYAELKKKAAAHDKHAEANKTDLERALGRAEAAEARVSAFEQQQKVAVWAEEIVAGSGIPASALRGSTRAELETHFEQLKPLLTVNTPKRVSAPAGVTAPVEGGSRAASALRQMSR